MRHFRAHMGAQTHAAAERVRKASRPKAPCLECILQARRRSSESMALGYQRPFSSQTMLHVETATKGRRGRQGTRLPRTYGRTNASCYHKTKKRRFASLTSDNEPLILLQPNTHSQPIDGIACVRHSIIHKPQQYALSEREAIEHEWQKRAHGRTNGHLARDEERHHRQEHKGNDETAVNVPRKYQQSHQITMSPPRRERFK